MISKEEWPSTLEHINRLMTSAPDVLVDGNGISDILKDVQEGYDVFAAMEFEHVTAPQRIGYVWQPKEIPDNCVISADVNPDVGRDLKAINPFSKEERLNIRLTDLTLLQTIGDEVFVRYDVLPSESDLVYSLLYRQARIKAAGESILHLSIKRQ